MFRKKALLKNLLISTCIVFPLIFLGVVAVLAAYIGPNRTVTTTTWERQYCNYRATITSPAGSCYLTLYDSPGSCPSTSSVAGYFSPGPLSCGSSWPGTCGAGLSCTITLITGSTQSCSSGETGCTQITSTTTYPPATVSGTTACTLPGNAGWCRGTATINLSGNEPLAPGYSLTIFEGSPGILCSAPSCAWTFPEGNTSLNYWVHSTFGDTSTMSSASMMVDSVAPTVTLTIPPPNGANGWFVSSATASASATDATSGVSSVRINGGGNIFSVSADGTYGLTAIASDNAGNTSTATGTMKLDTTIPTFMLSVSGTSGAGGWYVSSIHINSGAADVTSGLGSVQYSVDSGALQAGSSALISTDGTHTVSFKAIDNAGNMSTSSTQTVKIDTTGPAITVTLPPVDGSGGWYKTAPVTVTASASDATSGLSSTQYSVDGGALQAGSSVIVATDGTHTVSFRAVDNAGNVSSSSTQTVKIDTTAPAITSTLPSPDGSGGWYKTAPVTVTASASDATSGLGSVQYSLDGGGMQTGSSALISTDGTHTISFRAVDNAGNVSTSSTQTVNVDTTGPVITSTTMGTMGGGGWYITTAQVIASATDATSGLSGIQYSIDSGFWQSAPIRVGDGTHNIQIRATDLASNSTTNTVVVNVDIVRPASLFVSPPEGTSAVAAGDFTMTGHTVDVDSGPQGAEVSIDNGASWQALPAIDSAGDWTFVWDTTSVANGTYTVFVRATDLAGNQEHTAQVTVIVSNQAPFIKIAAEWWIWEVGQLVVEEGSSPISGVTITVSDPKGRWPNRVWSYFASQIPGSVSWDRHFGETIAPSGNYDVKATVCDMYDSCSNAYGTIKIPYPSTPTPTPVASQTPAQTPALTQEFPTEEPTKQVVVVVPVSTPAIVKVLEHPPVGPAKPQLAPKAFFLPRYLFPTIGMVSLLIALAATRLTDKRPRAIRQLAKSLKEYGQQTNRFNP
jgi:glutamine cyclotransferase